MAPASDRMLDVTVVLLEGGHPSTAIGPIEVFHSAGSLWNWFHGEAPRARFRVRTASIDGRPVRGLGLLGLTPECAIGAIERTDVIILSTSSWDLQDSIAASSPLLPWLRDWHARGAYVAGICTSVAYLAASGLLDDRQATTHWGVAERLRRRYPRVKWRPEQFLTEDGRIFCSGGVYSSIDLSLYLVEKFCGHEIALQCAKSLLLGMPRQLQTGYSVLPLSQPHGDERVRQAEEHLQRHFRGRVPIDRLAELAGMSPRNFIRRFKAATGRLPGGYQQALRMALAKEMLERGGLPVQSICGQVGYEDVAFFRSVFKRHTGMTPAEYRSRFARMRIDGGALEAGRAA